MWTRRTSPLATLGELHREMDRAFSPFIVGHGPNFGAPSFPALNLWEDGESIHAEAEVPGIDMNDLEIDVVGSELIIRGRRKSLEDDGLTHHRRERGTGEFSRFVTLPVDVDPNKVEAVLRDGVLAITLPKAETAKARRIAVQAK